MDGVDLKTSLESSRVCSTVYMSYSIGMLDSVVEVSGVKCDANTSRCPPCIVLCRLH